MSDKGKRYKIAVYGSLRVSEYNFKDFTRRFKEDEIAVIAENLTISGYIIFSIGDIYPMCIPSNNENTAITVDVLEVSEEAYEQIERMEKGAGYKGIEIEVPIDGKPTTCILYVGKNIVCHVADGDWSNYLKSLNDDGTESQTSSTSSQV